MSWRLYELQDLFLTYYHGDWGSDIDWPDGVASEVVRTNWPDRIRLVVTDLRELLARPMSDEELHELIMVEYDLNYDPWRDGIPMRTWLQGLLDQLEAALPPD
jgi:hypothetical protein